MLGVTLVMASSLSVLAADQSGEAPHVLVTAAEALVQRDLGDAAGTVIRAALASPGLSRTERARLRLADAARLAGANDETGAKKQIGDALNLDPTVTFRFPVRSRLTEMLEDARSLLPPATGSPPASSGIGREKPAASLVRIVDLLYTSTQLEAADIVLQVGWQYTPFTPAEQVQLEVRRGIVKADKFEDAEARKAFLAALQLDRNAKLPDWAPPKTVRQFEELRASLSPRSEAPPPLPITTPPTTVAKPSLPPGTKPSEPKETKQSPAVVQVSPPPVPKPAVSPVATEAKASPPPITEPTVPGSRRAVAETEVPRRGATNPLQADKNGLGVLVGGTGLALVAGGLVAGVVALTSYQAEQRASASGDYSTYTKSRDTSYGARNVADGLYVAGAVALGVSAYMWFRPPGHAAVVATVGSGQAAVVMGGHF